jgi:pyruvate carboxylase
MKTSDTDVYRYAIPGGQYSNLKPQVENLGLGHRFHDVKEKFVEVNEILGDIVKVTPSSKVVGDLAIFMVQNDLTAENIVEKGAALAFPDSVVSYFEGMMGQPEFGFSEALQKVVRKGKNLFPYGQANCLLNRLTLKMVHKKLSEVNDNRPLGML